jgi:glycosyltransferase involved in cell wall biosynthesis
MERVMAEFKRPLRFCMVTSFYPPYSFGGDAVFVHRLSNELAQRGHSVDVIHNIDAYRLLAGGNPTGTYSNHPGVRMHGLETSSGLMTTLAMHQLGSPGFLSARLKALLQSDFDVIHFHNVSLMGAPESLKYGNAVKLYTMHEYWLVCPTHTLFKFNREVCHQPQCVACSLAYKRPPQLWRYTGKLADAVQSIDAFLALNHFSVEMHRKRGFQSPIQILSSFVPRSSWDGSAADFKGRPYFLFVGRLERLKGLHTVLPVFEGFGETELWIAGDGS